MIKRMWGNALAFVGVLFMVPGIVIKVSGGVAVESPALRARILFLFPAFVFKSIGAFMVAVGRLLYVKGKRLNVIPAERLLSKDKRPPVLYLRSFEIEPGTKQEARRNTRSEMSLALNVYTQEEVLHRTLKRVGPCIAVGDPGSDEAILGFPRLKLGDDWQERVQELMRRAALVVYCAGGTPGVLWELEQCAAMVAPRSKLLLLVPCRATQEWWGRADELFGRLPKFTSSTGSMFFSALIYFDETDKPHLELVYSADPKNPRATLEDALDPLLNQLKVSPRPKLIRWLADPIHIFYLLFISLTLFVLAWIITIPLRQ